MCELLKNAICGHRLSLDTNGSLGDGEYPSPMFQKS